MKPEEQQCLLHALKPVLANKAKAEAVLKRYWLSKMALVWTTMDVHRAGNERGVVLTSKEAQFVLCELEHGHNKLYGIRWSDVTDLIKQRVLGRKITKRELRLLINRDIVAVAKAEPAGK